jgi:leucyl aminopeptidase (aminopeptidase T)
MKPVLFFVVAAAVLIGGDWARAQAPDPQRSASMIVEQAARVAEGEVVLIRGHSRDQELLEDIAVRCRAAGAFPLLQYTSDHLTQDLVDGVDPKFDNQVNALDVRLASFVNCIISIDAADNPGLLNHVPAERLGQRARADQATAEVMRRAGVRTVLVGNGLYPTAANANQYAVSQTELAKVFWAAAAAEPSQMAATGAMIRLALNAPGKEVRITNPNGTDLKFKIGDRRATVCDGTLDPEQHPGLGVQVRVPAGEVLFMPANGTAEGRVVVDNLAYRGRDLSGLSVSFRAGKVTGMSARTGMDPLKPLYDAAGPGRDLMAYLSIGVNPDVKPPQGSKINAPMPKGMVSVWIGNNTRAGGDNAAAFELPLYLPGSTLTVDGRVVVQSGRLVLPTSPLPADEDEPKPAPSP